MGLDWEDVLPAFAARVAADTGRDRAEVAERLQELRETPLEEVDVDEVVELLAPTISAIMGPVLVPLLERLERVPVGERLPVAAPVLLGILPALVAGVTVGMEAA